MTMRFLPVNLNALMVELDDLEQTLILLDALHAARLNGVTEVVPAARTLLITFDPQATTAPTIARLLAALPRAARDMQQGTLVEIPVDYDGEDLAEVGRMLGIDSTTVIARHTGSTYTVAFIGFAPGFAYLTGGHPSLDVPRRKTPRTAIPAGAVGLAGTFSGVYPQASPGGWQILGKTPLQMWDIDREPPALLQPGFRVRFVDRAGFAARPDARPASDTQEPCAHAMPRPERAAAPTTDEVALDERPCAVVGTPTLPPVNMEVLSTGLQALFQDMGRSGRASQGVSRAGAMDRRALATANQLAGNPDATTCLEVVNGGLKLRCLGETVAAVAGALVELVLIDADGRRHPVVPYQAFSLAEGDTLEFLAPTSGTRSYLAVRGGFKVASVMGSCSTDTLARVGPPAIAVGSTLAIGQAAPGSVTGMPQTPPYALPSPSDTVVLDIVMGPRTDWCTDEAIGLLARQRWQVTPQSNRVGMRLHGDLPLTRLITTELPSEGTVAGAIQVPANGQPVLFLRDHPLTGGYPVVAAVANHHLDLAGQIPVGAWVQFNPLAPFAPIPFAPTKSLP